jgi:2-hydroxychromene-2-carboxylate isomerase
VATVRVTHITDPACPWAYSEEPALTALRWRYGDQLEWRHVMIGLRESGADYEALGYTAERHALIPARFKRFGMPFGEMRRTRVPGTGRACRAIVSARMESEHAAYLALRALRFGWMTTNLLMDEDEAIAQCLSTVAGLDAEAIMSRIDTPEVEDAYQRDRAEVRSAAGSAASLQGKTANSDGVERYTASTLIFERGDQRLVAGGWQPLAAYDVIVANLDPTLHCRPAVQDPRELLRELPYGLTTREVALAMAAHNDEPDDAAATQALRELADRGAAASEAIGDDALWRPGDVGSTRAHSDDRRHRGGRARPGELRRG